MNNPTQSAVKKIKKVSRNVRSIFAIFIVGFVILALLVAFYRLPALYKTTTRTTIDENGEHVVTVKEVHRPGASIVTILTYAAGFVLVTRGLWCIYRLFSFFAQGDIFTGRTVAQLKYLGRVMLLTAPYYVWAKLHWSGSFTLLTDGFLALIILVIGLMIATMSWVMEEGRKLQEDCELTV